MKWHLNVKRPAYPLDASIILESDVKSLREVAGISYSACFAVIEKGQAVYYAPEIEVNKQRLHLKKNFKTTKKLVENIPNFCQKLLKEVKELAGARDISVSRFKKFLFLYRQFITRRVVTRIVGYNECLDQNFLSATAKARMNFKEDWEEVRKHLDKVWIILSKKFGITSDVLKSLTVIELLSLWQKKDFNLAKKIVARRNFRFIILRYPNEEIVFEGGKAADFIKKNLPKENLRQINIIKGQIASMGYAKGRVRVIVRAAGVSLKKRFILVTSMTTPDFIPLLRTADAIITDEGGLTCHAAIISRELNIPCVIGTKIATKVLRDGDLVEVDAEKGVVKILKRK